MVAKQGTGDPALRRMKVLEEESRTQRQRYDTDRSDLMRLATDEKLTTSAVLTTTGPAFGLMFSFVPYR